MTSLVLNAIAVAVLIGLAAFGCYATSKTSGSGATGVLVFYVGGPVIGLIGMGVAGAIASIAGLPGWVALLGILLPVIVYYLLPYMRLP